MSKRQGPAQAGDNDPARRAEIIRDAIDEILTVKADKAEANAKFKRRNDKAVATLKGIGVKMADIQPVIRAAELLDASENADKAEDRQKAADALKIMVATFTEGYAAITNTSPDELDLVDLMSDGDEARKRQFSTGQGKTTTKGGDAAAVN